MERQILHACEEGLSFTHSPTRENADDGARLPLSLSLDGLTRRSQLAVSSPTLCGSRAGAAGMYPSSHYVERGPAALIEMPFQSRTRMQMGSVCESIAKYAPGLSVGLPLPNGDFAMGLRYSDGGARPAVDEGGRPFGLRLSPITTPSSSSSSSCCSSPFARNSGHKV